MPTTSVLTLPPINVDVHFEMDEHQHSMPPQTTSGRYLEWVDRIVLTKTDYPQRTLAYSLYSSTIGYGSGYYGPNSSYHPILLENKSIYVYLPQDMMDSINNDKNQSYTSTVSGGITFPDQTMTMTNLHSLMIYKWVYKPLDGSTYNTGSTTLLTSGTHQITGDSVDVTIKYRPLTRGNNFFYCFSYEFDYSFQITCQINGAVV